MKSVMRTIPLTTVLFLIACQSQKIVTVEKPLPAEPQWTAVQCQGVLASVPAALARAEQIRNVDTQMFAYWTIATSQIKAGDATGALKTLDLAQSVAAKIGNDEQQQVLAYRGIAVARAAAGDVEGAQKIVALIGEIPEQVGTYLVIAEAQAKAGDKPGACETFKLAKALVTQIDDDPAMKARIYVYIAEVQAEAGDVEGMYDTFELAGKTAEQIKGEDSPSLLFGDGETAVHSRIVRILIKAGDLIEAKAIASTFNDGYDRLYIYCDIAKAQAEAGLILEAKATAAGLRSKDGDPTRLSSEEQEIYQHIIESQIKRGDIAGAKTTAVLINDRYWRVSACLLIAVAQTEAKDLAEGKETFEQARATAASLDEEWKVDGYCDLGKAYAKVGNKSASREAFELARKAVESISTDKDAAYENIAAAQADAGDPTAAKETLAMVESDHFWVYRHLAAAQAKAGDFAAARKTAELLATDKINSDNQKEAYKSILDAQLKAGDMDGARKTVAENLDRSVWGYQTMIWFQVKVGDIAGVRETAKQLDGGNHFTAYAQLEKGDLAGAITTAALIDEADTKWGVHLSIAEAQAEAGDLTAAVESIARAEQLNWHWVRTWNWDRLPLF